MRRPGFVSGGLQVLLSALALAAIAYAAHLHWKSALVVGLGLALSSTAVGLQLLAERKELNTDYGRMAFAILLFQDLVAIPLLAAIPLLGGAKEQTLTWPIALQAIGTLALVRSEEHTSELQSLMRISYAVFCLKKNKIA